MDDIGFLGPIDKETEEPRAIAKLYVTTDEGYEIRLVKHTLFSKVPPVLYLPTLDRKVHRHYVGVSPDDTTYFKFSLQSIAYPEYESLRYDLVDGGWSVEYDSRGDK